MRPPVQIREFKLIRLTVECSRNEGTYSQNLPNGLGERVRTHTPTPPPYIEGPTVISFVELSIICQ